MTAFFLTKNDIQRHFSKRMYDGHLQILVKTANFADTKTQAREGRRKRFSEGKTEHFRAFVPEDSQSVEQTCVLRTASLQMT